MWGIVNSRGRIVWEIIGTPALYKKKREAVSVLTCRNALFDTAGLRVVRVTIKIEGGDECLKSSFR